MSEDALITIILPTFRRPHMLPKAIESVLNQDFPRISLRIYDNCSDDETCDVVADYIRKDERISYYCHPENIGATANYSYALQEVRTPFFSFLADDDWLLPSFCASTLAAFEEFPAAQFVIGHTLFDVAGTAVPNNAAKYEPGFYTQPEGMLTLLKNRFPPPWIGILFRTKALREIGPYVTDEDGIDFGFMLRASHLEFAILPQEVAVFRDHTGSQSGQLSLKMIWPSHINAARAFLESPRFRQASAATPKSLLDRHISNLLFGVGRRALRIHDYEQADAVASILRTDFRKKARGSLLGVLATLMSRSPLVERTIDAAYKCKIGCARLIRLK